ncbi:hypothetical protein OROHE_011023 [Orobanche hederae]
MESLLVRMCIEAATESADAVEKWRRQRRTLERMPSHLDDALLRSLLGRRLLFPSLLDWGKDMVTCHHVPYIRSSWSLYANPLTS